MSLVGLDLNATRARAMSGPAGIPPRPLPLDDDRRDLALMLSLQGRHPEAGRAGQALCRRLPHLVCDNFLFRLGTAHEWSAGRHRLDAGRALAICFDRIRAQNPSATGMVMAVPPYLDRKQGDLLSAAATKAKLPYLGSVPSPVALSLSAFLAEPWDGPAIVVDLDNHALTFSIVQSSPGSVELTDSEDVIPGSFSLVQTNTVALPRLGLSAWKMRLVDGISDRCVHHSRRDPRDSGTAEQMLFDQLDDVFDVCKKEQMIEVVARGASWCQNLILRPEDVRGFCASLNRQAVDRLREALSWPESDGAQRVLVSAAAWRMPGLREALEEELFETSALTSLDPDAAAAGAHGLATYFEAGTLSREHLDAVVRCPLVQAAPVRQPEKKKRLFRF